VKSSHSRARIRPPSLQRQIETLLAYWRPVLGLESWGIQVRFDEKTDKANARVSLQYEEATLNFNLAKIAAGCACHAALQELTLHELVHCHEAPYDTETRVSRVTRSLLRAARQPTGCECR
jgi:hypothetical protein